VSNPEARWLTATVRQPGASANLHDGISQPGKHFFFEKKKQKTFDLKGLAWE
jgi:hypothetical protein